MQRGMCTYVGAIAIDTLALTDDKIIYVSKSINQECIS